MAVLVWIFAGFLVWTGASTLCELACAMPQNGGIQEYLRQCYGDFFGFIFAWTWVLIAKPCANAMASYILAEHVTRAVWGPNEPINSANTVIALLSISLITFINCLGANAGAHAANAFLVLKLFTITSIAVAGFAFSLSQLILHQDLISTTGQDIKQTNISDFHARGVSEQPTITKSFESYVTALFGALFAYGGWESVSCRYSYYVNR